VKKKDIIPKSLTETVVKKPDARPWGIPGKVIISGRFPVNPAWRSVNCFKQNKIYQSRAASRGYFYPKRKPFFLFSYYHMPAAEYSLNRFSKLFFQKVKGAMLL
jgi:hypothetical protein